MKYLLCGTGMDCILLCSAVKLTVDDLGVVQEELYGARTHWYNMGLKLGLKPDALDTIKSTCSGDPSECFRDMLKGYLKKVTPLPSWRTLAEALKSSTVGEQQLAEKVEGKHCTLLSSSNEPGDNFFIGE